MEALGSVKKCEKCGFELGYPAPTIRSAPHSPDIYFVDNGLAGITAAKMRYVGIQEADHAHDCKCDFQEWSTAGTDSGMPVFVEEHIERTCPRCGFIWGEEVIS